MVKEIPLTQGKVAIVDDEDYEWLMRWKWQYVNRGSGYARRSGYTYKGVDVRDGNLMHRQIVEKIICAKLDSKTKIDHKDHNGLNNQRSNIRLATNSQNTMNSHIRSDNQVGFKGVQIDGKRFVAYARFNGKGGCLGSYADIKDAARAYDIFAVENFGEFACTNFPVVDYTTEFIAAEKERLDRIRGRKWDGSSKYRGVHYNTGLKRWRVHIWLGREKRLFEGGLYNTEMEAAQVACELRDCLKAVGRL